MSSGKKAQVKHLAWHETLEMHELVAGQSNDLICLKMDIGKVTDPQLHALYKEAIMCLEQNIKDLLKFYPQAPVPGARGGKAEAADMTGFYAGHLLGKTKSWVRNYAIAITETATPALREVFVKHLNNAIKLHAKIFDFMEERSMYPAYDLERLLANDMENAKKALSM